MCSPIAAGRHYGENTMFIYTVDHEIELRIFEERHADELYELTDDNRVHLRQWLTWADEMHSIIDTRSFIRDGLRQFADNDGFQAGIWYYGDLVGCIGFHSIDWMNRHTELGYWLARPYTGKGIMTRSVRALSDHAFRVWRLHRVVIRCAYGNTASRAIPERLGFQQDGIMRDEIWLHDHFVDHVVYSLLYDEWRGGKR
jgi:ribosomal-protein-serine acetyltransferase